jgi:small GTP-binding protein
LPDLSEQFSFDVFLNHSSKDKDVVRDIAERLRADGLRVWFDEWEIKPGESIPLKLEEGLEGSRVLVLCLSANAFGPEWTKLEATTFIFRDPLNTERRFIPLRLDDAPIKGSVVQFLSISWLPATRGEEYAKLLEACRPPDRPLRAEEEADYTAEKVIRLEKGAMILAHEFSPDGKRALIGGSRRLLELWDIDSRCSLRTFEGQTVVWSLAWSADQRRALAGDNDGTVRLWDLGTGHCLKVFEGHSAQVTGVVWSADQCHALSASYDSTLRLWELETGRCLRILKGQPDKLLCVASSAGNRALSGGGSVENSVRVWDIETGECLDVLSGHTKSVHCVAWSVDQRFALSGSQDNTLRLWDLETRRCLRVLEGHTDIVKSVAWSTDQRHALSGSSDKTVRLWEVETGRCLRVLRGHVSGVRKVAWGHDSHRAFSGDESGSIRVWDLSEVVSPEQEPKVSVSFAPAQVQYTNAKVLLVGESGAGKTGLSKRLALNHWEPSDSTVGAMATQWKLPVESGEDVEREIWLWDFGGQADQRLIHQLYMDETALVVLVFDGQKDDLFETLSQWDHDLTLASRNPFVKLLVAGRVDAGGLRASRIEVMKFAEEHNFKAYVETSAKKNLGCEELKQAILAAINWDEIPCRTTAVLFKRLKEEIIFLKDEGRVLMRFNELREALQLRMSDELKRIPDEDLRAVLTLLAGPGVVWEVAFGSWVLLQPERVNAYAQAVIRTLQGDEHQRGCLMEERVLNGDLMYESSMERLARDDERFVLLAMHQTLVERGLCLRQPTAKGNLLVFPSFYRRERPDLVNYPAGLVTYRFTGFLDEIYATLVVRLHHSEPFKQDELWHYAAEFKTNTGKKLGVKMLRRAPGMGDLEVYFDPAVAIEEKIIFSKYVHEHLLQQARNVERLRQYVCPHCGTPVGNRDLAMKRLNDWLRGQPPQLEGAARLKLRKSSEETPSIICVGCEKRVPLWDEMEQVFASPEIQQQVRNMQEEAAIELSNQSKERVLVGEVISTVALADQICRELTISDHGIDMEIEFTDSSYSPTGVKLFLQLKSGDSYLRRRQRDGVEIFTIRNQRHAQYWMAQRYPVMLVIRNSKGEVHWMEISKWMKNATDSGGKLVKSIVFDGERFDVMSVRRWRERLLNSPLDDLYSQALSEADEPTRIAVLRRLAKISDESKTRDFFLQILQVDQSPEVRLVAAEGLTQRWWHDLEVRRTVRAQAMSDLSCDNRRRFVSVVESAREKLSGYWELGLLGETSTYSEPQVMPGYPAIRVRSFRLRNIGPFVDTDVITLDTEVNVILGDNAVGKSTVLRSIALASLGLPAANEVVNAASSYLRKGARRGCIEVLFDIVPDPDSLSEEYGQFAVGLEIVADSPSPRFEVLKDDGMSLQVAGESSERLRNSAIHLGKIRPRGEFGLVCSYGAIRTLGSPFLIPPELDKAENEWVLSLFNPQAWLVSPGALTNLLRGKVLDVDKQAVGQLAKKQIDTLRQSILRLLPAVDDVFEEGDQDLRLHNDSLLFGELSDSYRSLLALLGHLLRCTQRISRWEFDPTQIHGIILIDEVDIHLHPAWQAHVVRDFRELFPHLQFIGSTHSPLVVSGLGQDQVLIARRNGEGKISIKRPELAPQGLGVAGILMENFDLSSTLDQFTLDKITRRLELHSRRSDWTGLDRQEYEQLTEELAHLGFNREFGDPYSERFALAMARRHKVILGTLTLEKKAEIEEYADQLLAEILQEPVV